jgi:hypothetical protein
VAERKGPPAAQGRQAHDNVMAASDDNDVEENNKNVININKEKTENDMSSKMQTEQRPAKDDDK